MTAPTRRLIATEEHFLTEDYLAATEDLPVSRGEEPERAFMRFTMGSEGLRHRVTDVAARVAAMDAAGIDMSLLSLNPPGVQIFRDASASVPLVAWMNDVLAEMVASRPDRFAGLASIDPKDPEAAAAEIERSVGRLGLGGVLVASHTQGVYLDDPRMEPILSALEDQDATLYLHPRSPSPAMIGPFEQYGMVAALWGFQAEASTHALRLILSGTLDRHPRLRIVLGHLGEGIPCVRWRVDNIFGKTAGWAGAGLGMVDLELTPSEYFDRQFSVTTSGMADPAILRFVIDTLGADRVLFAVDYPYEDGAVAVRALDETALTVTERELVTHQNAERLFRIPAA